MASNRLSFIYRKFLRLDNIKNGWQLLRQKPINWSSWRNCYRRLVMPFFAGNTTLAFSIPGFSSKKEPAKKEVDPMKLILDEADRLYSENAAEELYTYLIQYKDMENDEVLWRLARAAVDKGKLSGESKEKKTLYYEAFEYIKRALALNDSNFAVHKWYAILLNYTGEYEGTKQLIQNSFEVKKHFMRAIELNPKDATSVHSLGYWCFMFADMTWYNRCIAKTLFATPPTSTYEEALKYFLQAEETEPNFYSMNLLMLGKTYMKLRKVELAFEYLKKCKNYVVKTPDDQKAVDEAEHFLSMLGQRHKIEQEKKKAQ